MLYHRWIKMLSTIAFITACSSEESDDIADIQVVTAAVTLSDQELFKVQACASG